MDNKEILEEMRKENQERMKREKRYKVLKVERYKKDLVNYEKGVTTTTISLAVISTVYVVSMLGYNNTSQSDIISQFIGKIILSTICIAGIGVSLRNMIDVIVSKVGLEQRIKDIELELEADKQIEEEQQGKVKTLSLENDNYGTKH